MTDTKILTNQYLGWFVGPSSSIPVANWSSGPTLTQLQALANCSVGLSTSGTTFNFQASSSVADRSYADAAGSESRSYSQCGGKLNAYTPSKGDTTSTYATTYAAIGVPRTPLVIMMRPVVAQANAIAAGDEVNLFNVITDARTHQRSDSSRTLEVDLLPQDYMIANYVVPSSTPTAPAVTPSGALAVTLGTPKFLKVAYEGRNITVGAKYVSSDVNIFEITNHGVIVPHAAGSATLTVSYPGAAALTPIAVTVS